MAGFSDKSIFGDKSPYKDYVSRGSSSGGSSSGGSALTGGGWGPSGTERFNELRSQVQQANMLSAANPYANNGYSNDYNNDRNNPFNMSGGTENLYNNRWNKAEGLDNLAIEAYKGSEWWNNATANILNDENLRFDANKFDLSKGLGGDNLNQLRNFAINLPGQMVGGILEGAADLVEAATGKPLAEYRETDNGYEIPDYQLDASQRAADVFDAAINIGGTFTGGAGRAVGAGAKIAGAAAEGLGKAAGKQAAEAAGKKIIDGMQGMSEGWVTRALTEPFGKVDPSTGKKVLGTGMGLVGDIGDEAAEEFAQSYAGDVREKNINEGSFERAVTGAAWGALGGGLMGGGGRAASHIVNKMHAGELGNGAINDKSDVDKPSTQPVSAEDPYNELGSNLEGIRHLTSYDNEVIKDKFSEMSRRPGSTITTMSGTNADLKFDDYETGVEDIKQTFFYDERSQQKVAHDFGTDVDTMHRIFQASDEDAAVMLNELIEKKDGDVETVVGRNPDTKNGGYRMRLVNVRPKQGFITHPAVADIVGADWDGDKTSIYFDPDNLAEGDKSKDSVMDAIGWASQMLYDPVTRSNIDWVRMGVVAGMDRKQSPARAETIFSAHMNKLGIKVDNKSVWKDFAKRYNELMDKAVEQGANNEVNDGLSILFTEIARTVDKAKADGNIAAFYADGSAPSGRQVVNDLMYDLFPSVEQSERLKLESVVMGVVRLNEKAIEHIQDYSPAEQQAIKDFDAQWKESVRKTAELSKKMGRGTWERRGTVGFGSKVYNHAVAIGMTPYVQETFSGKKGKKNPAFRQYAMASFDSSSIPIHYSFDDAIKTFAQEGTDLLQPVLKELVRASFKISEVGENPLSSIETLCDSMILNMTTTEYALKTNQTRVRSESDLNAFLDILIDKQNQYSKIYNEAYEMWTNERDRKTIDGRYRKPLSKDLVGKAVVNGVMDRDVAHVFSSVFGGMKTEEFVEPAIVKNIMGVDASNTSFDEIAIRIECNKSSAATNFAIASVEDGSVFPTIMNAIISDHVDQKAKIERIAKSHWTFDFSGVWDRYHKNGGKLDPNDYHFMMNVLQDLQYFLGSKLHIEAGLLDPERLMGTKFGTLIFNNNFEEVANAITSLSIRTQYKVYIDVLTNPKAKKASKDIAAQHVSEMRLLSPLHAVISQGILEGNYKPYNIVVNLDKSYSSKVIEYKELVGEAYSTYNYFADTLTSDAADLGVSTLSSRAKLGVSSGTRALKMNVDLARAEVESFEELVKKEDEYEDWVVGWFMNGCAHPVTEVNEELLGMDVYSEITIANAMKEKGTVHDTSSGRFGENAITHNGATYAHGATVFDIPNGQITVSQFYSNHLLILKAISDPDFSIELYDDNTGKRLDHPLTHYDIMRTVDPTYTVGSPITANLIFGLFRKYPFIAKYVCRSQTNVTQANGDMNVTRAAKTSLYDDYVYFRRGYKTDGKEKEDIRTARHMEALITEVKEFLYDKPQAKQIITLMLDDDIVDGDVKSERVTSATKRAFDELARHIVHRAINGSTVGKNKSMNAIRDTVMSKNSILMQANRDLSNIIEYALAMAEQKTVEGAQKIVNDTYSEVRARENIALSVADELEKRSKEKKKTGSSPEDRIDAAEENIQDLASTIIDVTSVNDDFYQTIKEDAEEYFADMQEEAKELLEKIRNLLMRSNANILADLSEEYLGAALTDEYRQSLKEHIVNLGYTEEEADDIIDKGVKNVIDNPEDFIDYPDNILVEEDFASPEALKKKLLIIYGDNMELEGSVDGDVDLIFKRIDDRVKGTRNSNYRMENGQYVIDAAEKRRLYSHADLVQSRRLLTKVAQNTNIQINTNAQELQLKSMDYLEDLSNGFIQHLSDKGIADYLPTNRSEADRWFANRNYNPAITPRMTYTSKTKQQMINNIIVHDASGGVAVMVGINGAESSKIAGLGHLSQYVDNVIQPTERPIASLLRQYPNAGIAIDYEAYDGWVAEINGEYYSINSSAFRRELGELIKQGGLNQNIVVYDPEDNPHGLRGKNTPTGMYIPYDDYHMISGFTASLIDYTQEAMVLKYKKLFIEVDRISKDLNLSYTGRWNRQLGSAGQEITDIDIPGLQSDCKKLMRDYRREFVKNVDLEFSEDGSMSDLGATHEHSVMLSQLLTPAIRVAVRNSQTRKIEYHLVDASCFFGPKGADTAAFEARLNELLVNEDGTTNTLISYEVFKVNLEECSNRIRLKLAQRRGELAAKSKGKKDVWDIDLTLEETEKIANEAMSDWTDYEDQFFSDIDDILSRIPPVERAHQTTLVAIDSPTPNQTFRTKTELNGSASIVPEKTSRDLKALDPEKQRTPGTVAGYFASSSGKHNIKYVTKSFICGSKSDYFDHAHGVQDGLLHKITNLVSGHETENCLGANNIAGILLRPSGSDMKSYLDVYKAAADWAIETHSHLLVPKEDLQYFTSIYGKIIEVDKSTHNLYGRSFVDINLLISPVASTLPVSRRMPSNSARPIDLKDILAAGVYRNDEINLGDAYAGAFLNMMDYFMRDGGSDEVPMKNYFKNSSTYEKTFIGKEEARKLLKVLGKKKNRGTVVKYVPRKGVDWSEVTIDTDNGPKTYKFILDSQAVENAAISTELDAQIKDKIVDYLSDIVYGDGKHEYLPSEVKKSEVACLLTDGTVISPVMFPKHLPEKITYMDVLCDGINVSFGWSGYTQIANPEGADATKMALMIEAFKGELSYIGDAYDTPEIYFGKNGNIEMNFAVSEDTENSRVAGRKLENLKTALYFVSKLKKSSLFFDGAKWKDWWLDDRHMPASFRDAVERGAVTDEMWQAFAIKPGTFSEDTNIDRAFRNMILICLDYHEDPMVLFNTYTLQASPETGELIQIPLGGHGHDGNMIMHIEEFHRIFEYFSRDEMLGIYHTIDPELCPKSSSLKDQEEQGENVILDANGMVRTYDPKTKEWKRRYVRFGLHRALKRNTDETTAPGTSSNSTQHLHRRAQTTGYRSDNMRRAMEHEDFITGNHGYAVGSMVKRFQQSRMKKIKTLSDPSDAELLVSSGYVLGTRSENKRNIAALKCIPDIVRHNRALIGEDGKKIDDPMADDDIRIAVDKFNKELIDSGKRYTYKQIELRVIMLHGASYNEGNGVWQIPKKDWLKAVDILIENYKSNNNPMACKVKWTDSSNIDDRYSMPRLPRAMAQEDWNSMQHIRDSYESKGGFEAFSDAMSKEQSRTEKALGNMDDNDMEARRRKKALEIMNAALRAEWNEPAASSHLYDDYSIMEACNNLDSMIDAMTSVEILSDEDKAQIEELKRMTEPQLKALKDYFDKLNIKTKMVKGRTGDTLVWHTRDDAIAVSKVLNNAAELSKVMAIIHPFVTIGNVSDRIIHQGMTSFAISLIHRIKLFGFNPYAKEQYLDQDVVNASINAPSAINIYASFRAMEFNDEEGLFLAKCFEEGNYTAITKFLEERRSRMTKFQKATELAYAAGSGGNIMMHTQMKNFINRFVMFAEAEGHTFWFNPTDQEIVVNEKTGETRPATVLEAQLMTPDGFSKFFAEVVLGSKGPHPSYGIAMKAMNSAKTGDIAQRNAVAAVLGHVFRKMPAGKFFMTTCISRFPTYGINITGRILNYVLPMSCINYVVTEKIGATDLGQSLGVQNMQIHRSLREAMLIDMLKLGAGSVALILFGLGMLQPPDDEKKYGNIDEWLLMGWRIGENWWVKDILGMAVSMAAFWHTASKGQPRFDIIINGIADACYSNPMIRCADLASWLLNPVDSLVSDYNEDVKQFQKAKGGPPSLIQWAQSNAFSVGMNWLSQFCTPSMIKEWYRASTPTEKSYKKIYEQTTSGHLTEAGARGATMYTTYDDAMKRRLAQRNPIMAWLFEMTNGTETSYILGDMPDNTYYDDYQLDSNQQWSVVGLSDLDREVKIVEIIAKLQEYDDMTELAKTGFHLDQETAYAVGAQIWDNYHAADEWYYGLQAEGKLNFYVLGEGDYAEGQKIAGELKLEWQNLKRYWNDFYNQKLKNSPITGTILTYNRYNTTYARDVNGEVYATGILRSPFNFLPTLLAPGTVNNPEGTAGYANDFTSVSAVTGGPMEQRALIPGETDNIEMPDLEAWSGDGKGNTYSQQYQNLHGDTGDTSNKKNNYGNKNSGSPSYPRRSYGRRGGSGGGRGGYSGGGGGGGRSYVPSVYAPSVDMPNYNVSRVMNTDRIINPNYDYLRPDFETKGSREAYKRSDI